MINAIIHKMKLYVATFKYKLHTVLRVANTLCLPLSLILHEDSGPYVLSGGPLIFTFSFHRVCWLG